MLLGLTLLLFLSWLIVYCGMRYKQQAKIKRWYNTWGLTNHLAVYQDLFHDINGFTLSCKARSEHDAFEYTYGEIDFIPFIALLALTKPHVNTVFYDLGSGVGKAAIACSMVFNVAKSCGIELFRDLHNAALLQKKRLQALPNYKDKTQALHFIHDNILNCDISDASLVFINATAFFGETWSLMTQHLSQLKTGTIVITSSKKLSSPLFVVTQTTTVNMSWGTVLVYIQQRK